MKKNEKFEPKCPLCGASMHLVKGKFGTFYACDNYKTTGCKGKVADPKRKEWEEKNNTKDE